MNGEWDLNAKSYYVDFFIDPYFVDKIRTVPKECLYQKNTFTKLLTSCYSYKNMFRHVFRCFMFYHCDLLMISLNRFDYLQSDPNSLLLYTDQEFPLMHEEQMSVQEIYLIY